MKMKKTEKQKKIVEKLLSTLKGHHNVARKPSTDSDAEEEDSGSDNADADIALQREVSDITVSSAEDIEEEHDQEAEAKDAEHSDDENYGEDGEESQNEDDREDDEIEGNDDDSDDDDVGAVPEQGIAEGIALTTTQPEVSSSPARKRSLSNTSEKETPSRSKAEDTIESPDSKRSRLNEGCDTGSRDDDGDDDEDVLEECSVLF
jgi:hypothetical protein